MKLYRLLTLITIVYLIGLAVGLAIASDFGIIDKNPQETSIIQSLDCKKPCNIMCVCIDQPEGE